MPETLTQTFDSPVFISADTARSLFRWEDAIGALQKAYAQEHSDRAFPARAIAESDRAWLRTLPAAPPGGRFYGAKLMAMAMGSKKPSLDYVIVLFDKETSRIAAFLDANLITGFRTAATSAAALDRLAPKEPARLAVIGSGLEATMHSRAFASIRQLTELVVFSPTPGKRDAFAEAFTRDTGVPARAVDSPEAAVDGANLVLTAARSRGEVPILHGDWLSPGMTVVSVGSTVPIQREIDVSVVDKADLIVCDMLHEVLDDTGDMIAAKASGIDIHAKAFSLNALMRGEIEAERARARIPMFKSVGGGIQDIVVADMLLTKALEAGLAQPLPMHFETKPL